MLANLWCDLWKPVTCRKRWNCKIKEINIIILMFFFIFYDLWTSVTFDSSIRGDPSKKFWKENNSNFLMIPITQNINFATCDGFSQITSHFPKFWNRHLFQTVNQQILPTMHHDYELVKGLIEKFTSVLRTTVYQQGGSLTMLGVGVGRGGVESIKLTLKLLTYLTNL